MSNEYRISRDELQRLAQAPLETRGTAVRVLQDVGSRRSPEIPPPAVEDLRAAWQPVYVEAPPDDENGAMDGGVPVELPGRESSGPRLALVPRGLRPTVAHDGRRAPSGLPQHGAVAGSTRGGGGGDGIGSAFDGLGHISCGGGNGDGAAVALVVVAVLAVAIAAGAAIGLVASEGTRFQGQTAIAPQQTLYIDHQNGAVSAVPLGALSAADLVHATGAVVKDDEGYGLALGPRDPLDRRGGAFGLELGATSFNLGNLRSAGPAAEIQVGGFFRPRWGLMLDIGVSGGDVALGGTASAAASVAGMTSVVTRHHVALELQAYPASLGPVHLGLFGRAGGVLMGTPDGVQGGPMGGGGLLVQLELTSRLALTLRGGVDTAHVDAGWSTAAVATAGVTIY